MEKEKKMKKPRMSKEEMEKKKKKITKIFLTIAVITLLAVGAFIANDYIILDKNKTNNLVINNKNVTANLKKEIIVQEGEIYLSKQDLANFFDKYIYEDKENKQIVTTYDKKIATIGYEKNVITINGSEKSTSSHAMEKEGTTYLPLTEMKDVYGIEISFIEKAKVVVIDSTSKEQKKAMIVKDVAVKSSTNIIAKTVDRVKKGSYVVVISDENGYAKIRTENGKIGYVKSNKIANTYVVRENLGENKQMEGKVNLVWDYYSTVASAPDRTGTTIEGINVVSPAFFYLDKNGNLKENVGEKGKAYIEWAHQNGYKVWPMVQNTGEGMLTVTSNIMNSYKKREKLIESIVKVCIDYKLDGINIDFENMKKEDIDLYSRFIIELTPRIKEMGLVISVDVTAPDGGETWSMCFDRHVIGDVADYIVFMAYDQYGASSTKAGTTAGYNWVELSLKKFLETEEIESNKIILALPLYTRLWTEDSNGKIIGKSTVDMKNIDKALPSGIEKKWDDSLKQNYVEYKEGTNTKKMWIEDIDSLKEKASLITKYKLGGAAAWEKGMETEEFWTMLKQELNS